MAPSPESQPVAPTTSATVTPATAPGLLRREPYRLLFPLGVALGCAGILHWLLHATHLLADYRPIFHAMTQVQGFLTAMAAGFLLTMIPRRTQSAPAAGWQIAACVAGPTVTVIAAWLQRWTIAQLAWIAGAAVLAHFALTRFHSRASGRRPPVGFVWISLGLLMGIAGATLSLVAAPLDVGRAPWHALGSDLVLQGLFVGFVLGAGSLALPLMTSDGAPPDMAGTAADRAAVAAHLGAAAVLVASFWIEATYSLRVGLALRAAVILGVLLLGVELWRPPRRPGWNARAIWLAAWSVPIGYLLAAAFPDIAIAGLHLTFIGGFALLALLISVQVTIGHGGYADLRLGRPWVVPWLFGLMFGAIGFRAAMELDPRRFFPWMAGAAAFFLGAALVWLVFVVPKLLRRAPAP